MKLIFRSVEEGFYHVYLGTAKVAEVMRVERRVDSCRGRRSITRWLILKEPQLPGSQLGTGKRSASREFARLGETRRALEDRVRIWKKHSPP
jgi:hypothetical protein